LENSSDIAQLLACRLAGAEAWIVRTQFPEPTFGPPGDHTMFEIVAPTKIDGVSNGASLALSYEVR
jgi:hypothetical protein